MIEILDSRQAIRLRLVTPRTRHRVMPSYAVIYLVFGFHVLERSQTVLKKSCRPISPSILNRTICEFLCMQQAIPLCLDQNTLSVLLSMVASTHDVDLCVFSCKTCYITYFSAECFYTKILAWKCLEYIILNNP